MNTSRRLAPCPHPLLLTSTWKNKTYGNNHILSFTLMLYSCWILWLIRKTTFNSKALEVENSMTWLLNLYWLEAYSVSSSRCQRTRWEIGLPFIIDLSILSDLRRCWGTGLMLITKMLRKPSVGVGASLLNSLNANYITKIEEFFWSFSFFMYDIQQGFICRSSYSTVSEDAGIEPRATTALAVRRSNHSARSHPPSPTDQGVPIAALSTSITYCTRALLGTSNLTRNQN